MLTGITNKEFDLIRRMMYENSGVRLKDSKKQLVISRLRKRLEELNIDTFSEYIPLLKERGTGEMEIMINALTTNETYFFRHTKQFNFLFENLLPEITDRKTHENLRQIRIWAAACSTGEEPYSLAITCKEFFKTRLNWNIRLFASDINTEVLNFSRNGLYPERSLRQVPETLKKRYFDYKETNKRTNLSYFRIKEDIIQSVMFRQHNLKKVFPERNLDVVFLRNVIIYFDKNTKQLVLGNIENVLRPGGYLVISLAENISDLQNKFQSVFSGVYKKMA